MKTVSVENPTLTPQPRGWQIWYGPATGSTAATLEEASTLLPGNVALQLVVPTRLLIVERLRLPAVERHELAGMVQLQWEKALPFSLEEIAGDFLVIASTDRESTVLSVAAPITALDALRQPLEKQSRQIRQVTTSLEGLAASAPEGETVLIVAAEDRHWMLLVVEDRRPAWVQMLPEQEAAEFAAALPQILLTASMDGVPNQFSHILVDEEAASLSPILQEFFELPITPLEKRPPLRAPKLDLLPASWAAETQRRTSAARLGRQLAIGAAIYLTLALAVVIYLAVLGRKSKQLDQELTKLQPQLAQIQKHQARWTALSPAIDPHRYPVELLFLLYRQLPNDSAQFTSFNYFPAEWRVTGEAPSAKFAIDYVAHLREDPELKLYNITANPPEFLNGERVRFNISGRP